MSLKSLVPRIVGESMEPCMYDSESIEPIDEGSFYAQVSL